MSYLGNSYQQQIIQPATDTFSGNGVTTTFQLTRPVQSVFQVEAVVDNVQQNPYTAYSINTNNQIVFTGPPPSGSNNIYVKYNGTVAQTGQPGQGTVNTPQLGFISNLASASNNFTIQTGANNTTAVTIDTSQNATFAGSVQSVSSLGVAYSTSGANIDLTTWTDGSFTVLEVVGSVNPNSGGAGYADPVHMYVYRGIGYSGSAVSDYIYSVSIAPKARDIYGSGSGASGNVVKPCWVNAGSEVDLVPNSTPAAYVRLKCYNYNATYGSGFQVRVRRLY
jgi:hypothetical protein